MGAWREAPTAAWDYVVRLQCTLSWKGEVELVKRVEAYW